MKPTPHVPISYFLPEWLRFPTVPVFAGNELRAVFPVFLSALALLFLARLAPVDFQGAFALMAYGFGSAAVGSLAFGHDFIHRTMITTLGQPVSRATLWRTRMRICVFLNVVLAVLAGAPLGVYAQLWRAAFERSLHLPAFVIQFFVPLASGICIAPWITLLSRSVLAGTVFTLCLPFVVWFAADFLSGLLAYDFLERRGILIFFTVGFVGLCGFGWFNTRSRMLHLEVLEPVGAASRNLLDSLFRRSVEVARPGTGRVSRWAQLIGKEARMQWMAIIPAVAMALGNSAITQSVTGTAGAETLALATVLWSVAICVIIGATGSAEERQIGVLNLQALLPTSQNQQWGVKIMVLFGLSLGMAVLWPLWLLHDPNNPNLNVPELKWWCLGAVFLVSASLYLSTLCGTTIKAVLLSLPVAGLSLLFIALMRSNENLLLGMFRRSMREPDGTLSQALSQGEFAFQWAILAPYLFLAFAVFTLLRFGRWNHFSACPTEKAGRQTGILAGLVAGALVACLALSIYATN